SLTYCSSDLYYSFTQTATSVLYPLSLHDALPISGQTGGDSRRRPDLHADRGGGRFDGRQEHLHGGDGGDAASPDAGHSQQSHSRSEEHTSELQSRENLVCRLLLEKKKNKYIKHCK